MTRQKAILLGIQLLDKFDSLLGDLKPGVRFTLTYKDGKWTGDIASDMSFSYGAYNYPSLRQLIDALDVMRGK
jgi:hypothetical protein